MTIISFDFVEISIIKCPNRKVNLKRDLRSYSQSTITRLVIGGLCVLFIVGFLLIGIFYNWRAAFLGVLCIAAGLLPVLAIIFVLWIFGKISSRDQYTNKSAPLNQSKDSDQDSQSDNYKDNQTHRNTP
jgi:hypothetical protein